MCFLRIIHKRMYNETSQILSYRQLPALHLVAQLIKRNIMFQPQVLESVDVFFKVAKYVLSVLSLDGQRNLCCMLVQSKGRVLLKKHRRFM